MQVKVVILDFDGTLADTMTVILNTMRHTLRDMRLPEQEESALKRMIGLPLEKIPSALLNMDCGEEFASIYRNRFPLYCRPGAVKPYHGVVDTLLNLKLKGIKIAIASSRGHQSIENFLDEFGIVDLVDYILGADEVVRAKPDPFPVLKTLDYFGFSAEEALVVGDSEFDIIMGKRAGARAVAATYGCGTLEELQRACPDGYIDDFERIIDYINS